MIPEGWGKREEKTRGCRWPAELAAEVDRVADETGRNFSEVVFYFVKWGLEERERQLRAERAKK